MGLLFNSCREIRRAALLGMVCLLAALSTCAQDSPLKSIAAIHAISNDQAAHSIPVDFEGAVTYYEEGNVDLFVQDGDTAIYAETTAGLHLQLGDWVRVEGITRASFRPEVVAQRVTFLRHGAPPKAVDASFSRLIRADLDCRRVKVRAIVRAANVVSDGSSKSLLLEVLMPGGYLQAQVANGGNDVDLHALLDSEVEIVGAAAGKFDSKSQMTGVFLEVHEFSDIHLVKPPETLPNKLPIQSFDQILQASQVQDQTQRVRVQGVITYFQAGSAMVLQNGDNALWVDTGTEQPHQIGENAIVSGFPDVRNGSVVLTRAEVQSASSITSPHAGQFDAGQLASGAHAFELVSVEGQLVTRLREAAQDQYVVISHGHVFSAIYRHPERGLDLPVSPMQNVSVGSLVRITGICVLDKGDQFRGPVAFHILLRSSEDVALVAGPSIVSVRNLGILLGVLLIAIFVVIAKALLLERKLRKQDVATTAAVERWRSRVIDGINNAIPLPETMLQITELLSLKLQVEYSWAEVELEGTFGNCPGMIERANLEIISQDIPARSGEALGRICVGSRRRITTGELGNAVRLAALAIETGGKYSDLVRRSEIDALTNVQNRFAFERALDQAIQNGKTNFAKFGLLYIDLDGFKQVNDQFGHNIGDRYLQEVASRLRHQLRPEDTLARIGGDEFAVIVAHVSKGEEVQEIASRLESCFNSPFALGNYEIKGYASIGTAVYPEDATNKEALLERADARMYASKRQRRRGPFRISATA